MEIEKALDQISEIHQHISRGEVFHNYRALPVVASGLVAMGGAALQSTLIDPAKPRAFVVYWILLGLVCGLVAGGGIVRGYLKESRPGARRQTRIVIGQLLPCLAAGALVTVALYPTDLIAWLPGLWGMLYSLGVFASRPYLPRMMGWIGLYYLAAGTILLSLAPGATSLSPWGMALTFGLGHVLAGAVLYWNLERNTNGRQ